MASGRLVDYLASGVIADRPASLDLAAGSVGLWFSTDTGVLSAWDGSAWADTGGGGGGAWGDITGTLSDQTDLQSALDIKAVIGLLAGINNQTGTDYAFVLADAGKLVNGNNAAAQSYTIPANADVAFPLGSFIYFGQAGTGAVTVAGAAGVTVNGDSGYSTAAQYDKRAIVQVATDVWDVL